MNLEHVITAVLAKRIPVSDACDEVIDDAVLNREALARSIIGPGSRAEQHSSMLAFFQQVAAQGGEL